MNSNSFLCCKGLISLKNDRTIYYELENLITSIYNQHVQELPQIFVFERERAPRPMSLIFTKNSPLTPFFKKAAQKSIQSGLRDALSKEWFGPRIKPVAHSESFALGIGQTFLIFIVMSSALIIAFLIFLLELVFPIVFVQKICNFFKKKCVIPTIILEQESRISFEEYRLSNTNSSSSNESFPPRKSRSRNAVSRQNPGYLSPQRRTPLPWTPIEQV